MNMIRNTVARKSAWLSTIALVAAMHLGESALAQAENAGIIFSGQIKKTALLPLRLHTKPRQRQRRHGRRGLVKHVGEERP